MAAEQRDEVNVTSANTATEPQAEPEPNNNPDNRREAVSVSLSTTGTSTSEEVIELSEREICRFNVLRNALVHTDRLGFFEFSHRFLMFAIVLSGTAGFGNLLDGQKLFAAFTALLGTIDLVFDLKGRIATHKDLRRRYYLLLAEIDAQPIPTSANLAEWSSSMIKITAEEPGEMPMVDAVAYNRAIEMLGLDRDYKLQISWWEKTFRHVWTYTGRTDMQTQARDAQDGH